MLSSRQSQLVDSSARGASVTPKPLPVTSAPVTSERATVSVQATAPRSQSARVPVQGRASAPTTPKSVPTSASPEGSGYGLKMFLGLAIGAAVFVTITMLNSRQKGVTATSVPGMPAASATLPAVTVPQSAPAVEVPRSTPQRPGASAAAKVDETSPATPAAPKARAGSNATTQSSDAPRSPSSTAAVAGESEPLFTFTKMLDTGTQLLNAGVPGLAYQQFQRTLNAVTSRIREQPGTLALDTLKVRTERLLKVAHQQCADSSDRKLVRAGCS